MMNVKIIGCGGVGLRLAPEIAMWLAYDPRASRGKVPSLTLIDGDVFEERNAARQAFDRIGNKAEVAAEGLRDRYQGKLVVEAEPEFIGRQNDVRLIREGDTVFCAVDKFSARKVVNDRVARLNNCLVIAGGNDLTDGSIQVYLRRDGKDLTLPLANEYHPEMINPPDDNPGDRIEGCDVEVVSTPQLGFTNMFVATMMLAAFYAAVEGKLDYNEAYFDLLKNVAITEKRAPSVANGN